MCIKAVGFDIDGTLYPFTMAKILSIPLVVCNLKFYVAFRNVRHKLREVRHIKDFASLQISMLAKELSVSETKTQSLLEKVVYSQWFALFKYLRVFPHLRAFLVWLKSKGVKIGVLSDFIIGSRLENLKLGNVWDVSLSSEESNYLKPHAKPFLHMCEQFGTEPGETLYVGNSEKYDIVGASQAGLLSALYTRWNLSTSKSNVQFSSYKMLQKWFEMRCTFD